MSAKDSGVGSVRPRSPGSPSSNRPSKVQKVSGLRWSDKLPSENEIPAPPPVPRDPIVIREFDAGSDEGASFFTCTSGELLWGHLNTLIEGSKSERVDTTSGPHETLTGGTIIQHNFRYRAKARKGVWKVEPAFIGDWHIGYVCYHEDVKGLDVLRKAAKVGISNADDQDSKDIMCVNRYDWGHWHSPGLQLVLDTLELGKNEDDIRDMGHEDDDSQAKYFWELVSTRFMLVDPKGLPTLIQALKDGEKLKRKNYLFHYLPAAKGTAERGKTQNLEAAVDSTAAVTTGSESAEAHSSAPAGTFNGSAIGELGNSAGSKGAGNGVEAVKSPLPEFDSRCPFGVNLVTKGTEYELGWMIFEKGELVGFVYDGAYSALEIYPEGSDLKLGGTVVTGLDEESEEEEDPQYAPSSDTESTDSDPDTRYYVGSETESEAGSQATSGQTVGSRDTQGCEEEQGEECMSKDVSTPAPALETIHEEEDVAEPKGHQQPGLVLEPTVAGAPQVVEDQKVEAPTSPEPSALS